MMNTGKETLVEEVLATKLGTPDLVKILAETPLHLLTPILIEAAKQRAATITPQKLLHTYDTKPEFFGISFLDQVKILKFKLSFYSILTDNFEAVEISPISPLGTNSVLTNVSQNKIMSTTRGSEVVGDPTTSLVLECASRRRKLANKKETFFKKVKLATFHRVLRMQPFDKSKGYMQQFNLLGLATAGRDKNYINFISEEMTEHIRILLDFDNHLNEIGYNLENITLKISNTLFIEKVINSLNLPRDFITRNSNNEEFNFIEYFNLEIPKEVSSAKELKSSVIEKYGLEKVVTQMYQYEERAFKVLRNKYPNLKISFNLNRVAGIGYYRDFCFHIYATNSSGREVQLSDGGSVDYVGKLVSDRKEYAITSGIGAELVQKLFMINN